MTKIKCNFCGSENYQEKKIDYLYQHQGKYLLVPNTPVEVCNDCGMIYYPAEVMKKIEQNFFSIYQNEAKPDQYLSIPCKNFSFN